MMCIIPTATIEFFPFSREALSIDFAAWMDSKYAGVPEEHIIRFLERCEVPTWIVPVGAPFTLLNLYTGLPLVSDEFRRTFFANYKLAQFGQAYQVWVCRSL